MVSTVEVSNEGPNMAKKKYMQSAKDRLDESRGMEREIRKKDVAKAKRKKYYDSSNGNGSAGMMEYDPSCMAGLPKMERIEPYPKNPSYSYDLNDDLRGIDKQISDDVKGLRRKKGEKYPEKW